MQYLRARYYDQGIGRFTQQDTYMGRNSDPITLHKYLYANSDPVSYTDPTGNFSLGSLSLGSSINGILTAQAIGSSAFDMFGAVSAGETITAKEAGLSILYELVGNKVKFLKLFSKACRSKGKKSSSCVAPALGGAYIDVKNWAKKTKKKVPINSALTAFQFISVNIT